MLGAQPGSLTFGASTVLTAAASPANVTGTVTFRGGTTILGKSSASGGVATFLASGRAIGKHSMTATYSGDSN